MLIALDPTTLHVSWNELPRKIARGVIVSHRIHYRRHNQASYKVIDLDETRECTITNLQPGIKYDVRVMSGTREGYPVLSDETEWPWQVYEMPSEELPEEKLPSPVLHLTVLNATSIDVKWTTPVIFAEYEVEGFKLTYRQHNKAMKSPIKFRPDARSYVLTNLNPHSWYEVQLKAYNSNMDGIEATQNIVTLSAGALNNNANFTSANIKPPRDLEAFPLSSRSIKLTWNAKSTINITYHTVRFRAVHSKNSLNDTLIYNYISSTNNEVVITDLFPFTLYEFVVRSHDIRNEHGLFSEKIECRTLEDIPTPPQDLTGVILDAHSVRLSWQPPKHPNGLVLSYLILFNSKVSNSVDNLDTWMLKEEKGAQLSTVVQNLSYNTQYYFCMRATTKAGSGPITPFITLTIPVRLMNRTTFVPRLDEHFGTSDPLLGIMIGLGIGLTCIVICAIIIACRNR